MAVTKFEKDLGLSFVVGEEFFRTLDSMFQKHESPLNYRLSLSDSTTIEHMTLDELLDFQNSSARRILSVLCKNSYSSAVPTRIHLSNDWWRPVSVSIEGDDATITRLSKDVVGLISDTAPWHSFARRLLTVARIVITLAIGWMVGGGVATHDASKFFIAAALIFFACIPYSKIFPIGQFAIGGGIRRVKQAQGVYHFVFIMILLSLLVGIVATKLERYITF